MALPLGYNAEIGKRVRELSAGGATQLAIMEDIQRFASAPATLTTFLKYYGDDYRKPRNDISMKIGNRVANQALEGDPKEPSTFKSQELWLRTQASWTPKESLETREVGDSLEEQESAVDTLMKLLGKSKED